MFEKFLSRNVETFRQRYEGTFGFLKDENGRTLVLLHRIGNDTCYFRNKDGLDFQIDSDTQSNVGFEFLPPETAWHNTTDGAYLVTRTASRQFQRGVCARNTNIYALSKGVLKQKTLDFATLLRVYDSKVKAFDASQALGLGGSCAISKSFALNEGVVYLMYDKIGKYSNTATKFTFNLDETDLWKTEISDAMKAIKCEVEFK